MLDTLRIQKPRLTLGTSSPVGTTTGIMEPLMSPIELSRGVSSPISLDHSKSTIMHELPSPVLSDEIDDEEEVDLSGKNAAYLIQKITLLRNQGNSYMSKCCHAWRR
jgi:hypothetical protein